jgi:predicted glycosyltransferase
MRCLFFTNTPAHVHLFRYAARDLIEEGHTIRFMARDYGCTLELLDYYELPYDVIGKTETNKFSVFKELPIHYKNFLLASRSFNPDIIFGTGAYPAHTGAVTGATTILVVDSEPTWINHAISKPFADVILTPHGFRKNLGPKQVNFKGFEECAYLHPEVYKPIDGVYEALGLDPDERYVLLRFNAWGSSHDFSNGGFSDQQRRELIERLAEHATVLVSDEGGEMDESDLPAKSFDVHPALFHEALRNADLLVADTQTAVTEAALLGTPAIRSNTWVGENDMGNFIELEENDLVYNLASFDEVLVHSEQLIDSDAKLEWERRSEEYMSELVNLTELFIDITNEYGSPEERSIMNLVQNHGGVVR